MWGGNRCTHCMQSIQEWKSGLLLESQITRNWSCVWFEVNLTRPTCDICRFWFHLLVHKKRITKGSTAELFYFSTWIWTYWVKRKKNVIKSLQVCTTQEITTKVGDYSDLESNLFLFFRLPHKDSWKVKETFNQRRLFMIIKSFMVVSTKTDKHYDYWHRQVRWENKLFIYSTWYLFYLP